MTTIPNTEKRDENTTCSGVVLVNFLVLDGKCVKQCLELLIHLLNRN